MTFENDDETQYDDDGNIISKTSPVDVDVYLNLGPPKQILPLSGSVPQKQNELASASISFGDLNETLRLQSMPKGLASVETAKITLPNLETSAEIWCPIDWSHLNVLPHPETFNKYINARHVDEYYQAYKAQQEKFCILKQQQDEINRQQKLKEDELRRKQAYQIAQKENPKGYTSNFADYSSRKFPIFETSVVTSFENANEIVQRMKSVNVTGYVDTAISPMEGVTSGSGNDRSVDNTNVKQSDFNKINTEKSLGDDGNMPEKSSDELKNSPKRFETLLLKNILTIFIAFLLLSQKVTRNHRVLILIYTNLPKVLLFILNLVT